MQTSTLDKCPLPNLHKHTHACIRLRLLGRKPTRTHARTVVCMAKSRDLDLSRDQTVEGVETCSQCITSLHSPHHVRTLFLNILISSAIRQVSGCPLEKTEIYV